MIDILIIISYIASVAKHRDPNLSRCSEYIFASPDDHHGKQCEYHSVYMEPDLCTQEFLSSCQIQHASNADANEQPRMDGITHDRARVAPLEAIQTDSVGYEKSMTTKATLHRDGKVVVKSSTSCHDMFHGLRGRVLIVLRDVNGDTIGVTDKMCCTTRGGLLDFLTPSFGDDTFFLEFPREVASLATVLDIWQADDASVKDILSRIHEKAQDANIAIAHIM